ncbi:MAG: GNAT family N-acetyltransferase [Vallitaleaceae bacterium]|nr:GNAT family N-acetyltransferase [Vallitaleaceae bacterium]
MPLDKNGNAERIQIKKADIEDLSEIRSFVEKAIQKMRDSGNFQWDERYPKVDNHREDIVSGDCFKAVIENGNIVGVATMNDEEALEYQEVRWGSCEKAFVLHRLIIHPDYQKQGIGKALSCFFEEEALRRGYQYLRLDAYSQNQGANRLYQQMGYQIRGEVHFRGIEAAFYCMDKFIGQDVELRKNLGDQMAFLAEIDKMKSIYRQTMLMDGSRHEDDAEHSWHLAMMAVVLASYSNQEIDVLKVIKMVLIHDLVEIDAGDTFIYDEVGNESKSQREMEAAERIFGLLPEQQGDELKQLWEEFEKKESPEAKFAASLDRIQPMMNNYYTKGHSWKVHQISVDQVKKKNGHAKEGAKKVWDYAEQMLERSVRYQYLGASSEFTKK